MKPQLIFPVSLLLLAFMFSGLNASAAEKRVKESQPVKTHYKDAAIPQTHTAATPVASNTKGSRPGNKPHKEEKKDGFPKEGQAKKAHSEEDGKHHHFHMHRAKRAKRFCNMLCVMAKLLLLITHICLLLYVFKATLAH
jgi:hypothetical protein